MKKTEKYIPSFEKILKVCGQNVEGRLRKMPFIYILTMTLLGLAVLFSYGLPLAFLVRINFNFGILVLAFPLYGAAVIAPAARKLDHIKIELKFVSALSRSVKSKSYVYLDADNFERFDTKQTAAVLGALILSGALAEYEILGDIMIARKDLNFTLEDAEEYFCLRSSKSESQVIIKLSDTETDEVCDNCGQPFAEGENFCANCGTMRKDIRRRV